jgi:haloacetate dehalogenase
MTVWNHMMATVNGIQMHYVIQGQGPLLVLLHGWPQTWYAWRTCIPALAQQYTVVAPDLRGYGLTDKPADGYDKRTMAADIHALVQALGYDQAMVVGHDRGARVAQRYGLDYPQEVVKLALLDVIPTHAIFTRMDTAMARSVANWLFLLQADLPELLIGANIAAYLRYIFEHWAYNRTAFDVPTIAAYVEAYSSPGALRGGLSDYRATFPEDLAADETSFRVGQRLTMPVLVLWGSMGLVKTIADVLAIWRTYATDVRGEPIPACGHFLAEEQPEVVLDRLCTFLNAEPVIEEESP